MVVRLGFRGPGHVSQGLAAVAVAASDIASLTVVGATPLLDKTNDYGDATARTGVNGDGWVARATLPYLAGQTFDPSKISLTVTDPGFDGAGATTVTRTVTGRAVLRRQYNAASASQASNDGVTLTVYFSLSDDIYQGSTITAATAAAGVYGATRAGAISGVVNSSTVAYPKPLFGWLNLQHERWTGASLVEAVAFHRHAMNGRQVARVEFIARDSQASPNVAATQIASAATVSTLCTQGQPPECYAATIPVAALAQADLCFVNARVYPWIGDSSAVLDLMADGISTSGDVTTARPLTPLRFLNDKAGSYGGAIAYVRAGAAGTPQVALSAATARANPYATLDAALAAVQAFNVGRGHNDHSGADIYLMDDGASGAVAHAMTASLGGVAAGKCWTNIRPDPAAVGAVSVDLATINRGTADLLRWMVNLSQSGGYFNGGLANGNVRQAIDGKTLTVVSAPGVPLFYQCGLIYLRNVTFSGLTGSEEMMMGGFSTTRTQCAMALGVINGAPGGNLTVLPYMVVGCAFRRVAMIENDAGAVPNMDSHDGLIVANNRFLDSRSANMFGHQYSYVKGAAYVQNVLERAVVGTSPALQISADSAILPIDNIVDHHNTIVGERTNRIYADVAGAAGVIKKISSRFNIWQEYNCKTDTYVSGTTATGRVGNWRNRHAVGHLGNVCIAGQQGGGGSPTNISGDPTNWLGEAWPAATYAVGVANVTFANNQSLAGANGGAGSYVLTHGGTDAAANRVPAGAAVLAFDLAGAPRPNDGAGSAGAYQ